MVAKAVPSRGATSCMKLAARKLPPPSMFLGTMAGRPGMCRTMCRASSRAYRSYPPPTLLPIKRLIDLPEKNDSTSCAEALPTDDGRNVANNAATAAADRAPQPDAPKNILDCRGGLSVIFSTFHSTPVAAKASDPHERETAIQQYEKADLRWSTTPRPLAGRPLLTGRLSPNIIALAIILHPRGWRRVAKLHGSRVA